MTHRRSFATVMLLTASLCALAERVPFSGANCQLKQPPTESGEENVHGYAAKIFPRKKNIASSYAGCVIMWTPTATGYEILGMTKFEHGIAVAHWSPVNDQLCKYKSGEPFESPGDCPMYHSITPRSMPAGCVERMMKAGGGVPGCEYE